MTCSNQTKTSRPKWLVVTLSVLSFWWGLLVSIFFLFVATAITSKFFGFELHWSHPGTQILAVFICLIALVCGGFVAMLQNRVLRARSSKLSYIVLGFLALITLLFVPTPFNVVIN